MYSYRERWRPSFIHCRQFAFHMQPTKHWRYRIIWRRNDQKCCTNLEEYVDTLRVSRKSCSVYTARSGLQFTLRWCRNAPLIRNQYVNRVSFSGHLIFDICTTQVTYHSLATDQILPAIEHLLTQVTPRYLAGPKATPCGITELLSTLDQPIACCLMSSGHDLSQHWFVNCEMIIVS